MLSKERENEMVNRVKRGDRQAMEALVTEFEKPVFNTAFRMLGNRDDAADVSQTTFLKVFQNIEQFNPTYRLFSWVYRIAMNESMDVSALRSRSGALNEEPSAAERGPGELADADQTSHRVQHALMQLSNDYRSVIVLRYFTGSNYREMAATLNIPEKTVKSRLYSARQQLKVLLERDQVLRS